MMDLQKLWMYFDNFIYLFPDGTLEFNQEYTNINIKLNICRIFYLWFDGVMFKSSQNISESKSLSIVPSQQIYDPSQV